MRFKELRLRQLEKALGGISPTQFSRPQRGWLQAIRELKELTLRDVAPKLGVSYQTVAKLEKAEAEDRITMGTLRKSAEILECELVYALVPKQGNLRDLAETKIRDQVAKNVVAVEHTMALENQAVGGVKKKIDEEMKRQLSDYSKKP